MTAVKICGITRAEDAFAACDSGAEALGFIFFEPSPRYIRPGEAKRIIARLPRDVATVGVFVDPEESRVRNIREYCGLDFVQLSGDETPDFCRQIPGSILLKVVPAARVQDPLRLDLYRARAFLVDSREGGLFGGTGKLSDWELAKKIGEKYPVILAGGLKPENIEEAIIAVSPAAVDVGSGVEISPGKKDHKKMRMLLERVRLLNRVPASAIFRRESRMEDLFGLKRGEGVSLQENRIRRKIKL